MKTLNKVLLLGSVGKDPEIRSTGSGSQVASLSIATNHRYKDSGGNWQEETTWHNLTAFGKTAEVVRDYVKKGDPIHAEGRIKQESWNDKTSGEKKYKTVIVVESLILLGKKEDKPAMTAGDVGFSGEVTDEDIPF